MSQQLGERQQQVIQQTSEEEHLLTAPSVFSIGHEIRKNPPARVNGFLVMLIFCMVYTALGFLAVPLPDLDRILLSSAALPVNPEPVMYTLQLPFALFAGAMLGPLYGTGVVVVCLLVGLLVLPLFANGGGLDYLLQPGFGYLVGMALGAFLMGQKIPSPFRKENKITQYLQLTLLAFAGVFAVHMIGNAYLILLSLLGVQSFTEMSNWWHHLSLAPIGYDVLMTISLFWLVRPLRYLLWWAIY